MVTGQLHGLGTLRQPFAGFGGFGCRQVEPGSVKCRGIASVGPLAVIVLVAFAANRLELSQESAVGIEPMGFFGRGRLLANELGLQGDHPS